MKKIRILATLAGLTILAACDNQSINPSSNITIQDRSVGEYTGIVVSTVMEVDVTFSDTEEKIEIEANENLHAYIDVYLSGNQLIVKVKDNTSIKGSATLRAHIYTGNPIEKVIISDAASLIMNNELSTNNILLAMADATFMNANVSSNTALVRMEGAAKMMLTGDCGEMDLFMYDATELRGFDMQVDDVIAQLEGAADSELTINDTIVLAAKDASSFSYKGDAVITDISLQDAAEINKIN